MYKRQDLNRGNFRVKGDTVDIYLAYTDNLLRVTFWGDEIDGIEEVDPITGATIAPYDAYKIYPANLFMTTKEMCIRDRVLPVSLFDSSVASFTRWLSPPERVVEDCPNFIYPSPTSCNTFILSLIHI